MSLLVVAVVALNGALALTVGLLWFGNIAHAADGPAAQAVAPERVGPSRLAIAGRRLTDQLWSAGATIGARLSRAGYPARAQHHLDLAGNPPGWTPQRLLAVRGVALTVGVLLGLLVGASHGLGLAVLFALGFGMFGFVAPDLIVRRRGEARQAQLRRDLPYAMDMLTVCVEAGMGFDSALTRVARLTQGPVADECARLLQEMQFGMSRSAGLRALAERTDVPELRTFVAAMVQAAEVGISIGDVLREQSRQMRIGRRQRAEEKAQKMQVKLLLPLISCLLPAMFVVVLGPAVIHLAHFFAATK
jgi:tight adherence protein C